MKILSYSEIPTADYENQSYTIVRTVKPILIHNYSRGEDIGEHIDDKGNQITYLLGACNGKLEGRVVCDLGCGRSNANGATAWGEQYRTFEPWLLRILGEWNRREQLNMRLVGIDYGFITEDEPFKHHKKNLLEEGSLDFFKTGSVDVVNAHQFFNSDYLYFLAFHTRHVNTEYKIKAAQKLLDVLMPQLDRILKSVGVFMYDTIPCKDVIG